MIPIIPSLLILFFTPKYFSLFYFYINFILALYVYYQSTKYYFPDMKNIKDQYFHEKYKTFERDDLHMLSLFRLYHSFLNYFWFKVILAGTCLIFVWAGLKFIFKGKNNDYKFTEDDRHKVVTWNKYVVRLIYNFCSVIIYEKDLSNDPYILNIYRKYLGPYYNPENNKYSSVISNHISWMDIVYLEKKFSPSFIAKESVKNIPFVGLIAWGQKSAFIARKEKNAIEKTKEFINIKQKEVYEGKDYFPLGIYPEATTSNGKYISSFKLGAFHNLFPTKGILLDHKSHKTSFPICCSAMDTLIHMCLTFSFLYTEITAYDLPVFAPNDYLYKNFAYLGKDKAKIYAEAIRLIWSEILNCPIGDGNLEIKLEYKSKIKGKIIKDT